MTTAAHPHSDIDSGELLLKHKRKRFCLMKSCVSLALTRRRRRARFQNPLLIMNNHVRNKQTSRNATSRRDKLIICTVSRRLLYHLLYGFESPIIHSPTLLTLPSSKMGSCNLYCSTRGSTSSSGRPLTRRFPRPRLQ